MPVSPHLTALHGFLGLPSDWDLLRSAGFEIQALDVLHEPLPSSGDLLLGYSMGGRLALQALLGGAQYRKAIFVSTRISEVEPGRQANDEAWAQRFESQAWPSLMRDWNAQRIFQGHHVERREEDFDRLSLARALREWSPAVLPAVLSRLREIEIPTLWIAGAQDAKYVGEARRAGELVPGARVEIVEGAAHRAPWEQPEAFLTCVRDFSR